MSAHRDGHPADTERRLKAELHALQFEKHAMLVLQLRHLSAADYREARARRRISAE